MKVLDYECLKTVIQHMEANTRIRLAQRLPSIGNLEKLVPLKIDRLEFKGLETIINDTTYKLGSYTKYEPGHQVPKSVQRSNAAGGDGVDVKDEELTQGDLLLEEVDRTRIVQPDPVAQEQYAESNLRKREMALARRRELNMMEDVGQLVRDLLGTLESPEADIPIGQLLVTDRSAYEPPDYKVPRIPLVLNQRHRRYREFENEIRNQNIPVDDPTYRHLLEYTVGELEQLVEASQIWYQMCHCALHGIPLPYTKHLQFTIKSSEGLRRQITPNGLESLPDWFRKLNTKLFGSRSESLRVKNFVISNQTSVLRLPPGFKIHAENLTVRAECVPSVTSLLASNLDTLSIEPASVYEFQEILQTPLLQNTRKRIIHNWEFARDAWVSVLRQLQNEQVELKYEGRNFPPEDFFGLVQDWLENGRPLETLYSTGLRRERTGEGFLEMLRNRLETKPAGTNGIVPQMANNLYLHVYYRRITGVIRPLRRDFNWDYFCKWVLELRVEESEVL